MRAPNKAGTRLLGLAMPTIALLALLSTPAVGAPTGPPTWTPDLTVIDEDDSNVRSTAGAVTLGGTAAEHASARTGLATGFLQLTPHQLDQPVNRVAAAVRSEVPAGTELAIDVRGQFGEDEWTEWAEAKPGEPAVISAPAKVIQIRVALTAPKGQTPKLTALTLNADLAPSAPSAQGAAGLSYRVFATREGLVGGTTANGHVIVARDHFVALPSRRGLASKGTGTYSVKVCAANGRCEWAPVWDVGPWNIKDDYWNPSATREMWKNLPQGKPQAQAAYQDGYNGGKDGFGRTVANPAGIDLADGTFWDGLKLTDNSWVTVEYLWTGGGTFGTVRTAGDTLNVRTGASSANAQVGLAANFARVKVECQVTGENVTGTQGTSNVWFRISAGKFVAKAYIAGVGTVGRC
ncbi:MULTISPECIES: hypothetical protein [unclassified Crossiella]|uniref:hypothetical protein n=1 Tax=unclassified Crossiella TaxID=2620835 RepID=UPI001FFF570B|nr:MULTISPECIES: hypothetical protein [unclassified Crossiella]MCK2236757.1 hypothetical protein [Crossiella sp. S99.2]MCK2250425.1 hypothetical protein [Crossiella sp. S99.1]